MRLYTACPNCKSDIHVKPTEHSRYDLSRIKGNDEFLLKCTECNRNQTVHVNDVVAVESKETLLIFTIIILIICVLAFFFFMGVGVFIFSTIPFIVIAFFYNNERQNVSTFNKYHL